MPDKELKIAGCQMEVEPGHPERNFKKIAAKIEEAKSDGDDIVIFPEMAVPGYLLGDEWENEAYVVDCFSYNDDIVKASQGIAVVWGNVDIEKNARGEDGRLKKFNTAFVACDGKLIGRYHKTLHPNYREFDDERHFYSSRKEARDQGIPLEDYLQPAVLEINGFERKMGVTLCEDMWSSDYSANPIEILLNNGSEFIVNISCSPWTWRKNNKRHRIVRQRLKDHPAPFIYVNNVGTQNNGKNIFLFDGNSTVYNKDGSLRDIAGDYREQMLRTRLFSGENPILKNPELSPKKDNEELLKGLIFGIRKFFDLVRASKVVIGVSGGVDSSLSAYLLAKAIGPENVYAVNMPSQYNSETTKGIAADLVKNLQLHYAIIPIQEAYESTVEQLNSTEFERMDGSGEKLKLELSDLDKENIQARDRGGRVLAGVASALGALFVNNGNKTETALGYATLYGDVNGALAPIADLYKTEVYELCGYINDLENKEVFPKRLFDIPASAELSDKQDVDKGQGDPILYHYHDRLMRAFIEFRLDPQDILQMYLDGNLCETLKISEELLSEYFNGHQEFIDDLEHKWRLYKINFFKRIQAPPIIAVSRRAFGYDLREAQIGIHYTRRYLSIKERLLGSGEINHREE